MKHQIDDLRDPNFRAEASLLKSGWVNYGHAGTIRVDVFERARHDTVCVYGIKTGRRGMDIPRLDEIVGRVRAVYPETRRTLITAVRPYAR
ncbi:hypothetical protein [Phreatobacter sp.]|uniref:hypothetical protein n=1 Tax=Phreatobacter sp. TaxID=1966341 RepID=UPI0025CF5E70|nr:hypothetical protein [Phreatobacter sp.]